MQKKRLKGQVEQEDFNTISKAVSNMQHVSESLEKISD